MPASGERVGRPLRRPAQEHISLASGAPKARALCAYNAASTPDCATALKLARPSFFVLIALVGAFAIFSSTLSKTPVLPLFAQALHASPAQTGWIVMASTLPGILISYPAGALADRIGRRRVLLASLWVFASAPLLYLGVHSVAQLIAVRFYHGFATAIFGTVAMAAIAARYPNERAARLSTYSSLTIAGRSAAPFVGGALLSLASFSAVYIACAISGVLALLIGSGLSDTPVPADEPNRRSGAA
jgi:Arabinose efflux permease